MPDTKTNYDMTPAEMAAAGRVLVRFTAALQAEIDAMSAGDVMPLQPMALALASLAGALIAKVPLSHRGAVMGHVLDQLAKAAGAKSMSFSLPTPLKH